MSEVKKLLACLVVLLIAIIFIGFVYYYVALRLDSLDININGCLTFAFAFVTLAFTASQYLSKRESDKTNLLLSYNERFMSDVSIQKVISYIQYFDENKGKKVLNSSCIVEPTQSEFIQFARFFEELQSVIKSNNIDKEYACRLYAYYAVEAYINHKKKIGNVDTDESWFLFRSFCQDMMKVEESLNIKHE